MNSSKTVSNRFSYSPSQHRYLFQQLIVLWFSQEASWVMLSVCFLLRCLRCGLEFFHAVPFRDLFTMVSYPELSS